MKTIQSFLCASALLCAALPASAAWPTKASFEPNDSMASVDQEITVTFDNEAHDVDSQLNVIAYMVGGIGFGQDPYYELLVAEDGVLTFSLNKEYWGYPANGEYSVNIGLIICDEEYNPIEDEEGGILSFEKTYQRIITGPAECLLQFPNEWNWTQEGLKFSQFYEYGYGTLYFSKPIEKPKGAIGKIVYNLKDGYWDKVDITSYEYSVDVDPLSGMWTLSFNVVDDRFTAADIESMEINFNPFKSLDGETEVDVEVEPMTIVNNSPATPKQKAVKKQKESGLSLGVSTDAVTVYNLQGIVVMENATASSINNLPAGVYIINGKKVAIR